MKRNIILFLLLLIIVLIAIMILNKRNELFFIETFELFEEKVLEKKVVFLNKVIIRAPSDDFVELIHHTVGDFVSSGTDLIQMENNEEAYQLAKAKNEFAISLLNSGTAVQEEKKKAVDVALNKLENTKITTPVNGFILSLPVNENLFVSQGTILTEILPSHPKVHLKVSPEEEELLRSADIIEMHLMPSEEKGLLNDLRFVEQNTERFLEIPMDMDQIDTRYLNNLYCRLKITYSENTAAWIPAEFVNEELVLLEDGRKKEVTILERKNDLYLVMGLTDGDTLKKKR